jgi:hypothetical protein
MRFQYEAHSRTQSPSYARCDEGLWPNPYSELASDWLVLTPDIVFLPCFLWYPVMDLARAPRRTVRKKGSRYENVRRLEPRIEKTGSLETFYLIFPHLLLSSGLLEFEYIT